MLRARGTVRRQRDRIAGRIAAKRALVALTGVEAHAISIPRAESGEPLAQVPGHPEAAVSLSHTDGEGIALAVNAGRVGLDQERTEERSASFLDMWFDEQERGLATDAAAQNLIWCAKEAVLKVLGTGMAIAPRHVQVRGLRPLHVQLTGPAQQRQQELGGALHLHSARGDGVVRVVARLEPAVEPGL